MLDNLLSRVRDIPGSIRAWWNLYRMRCYWNDCAKENARKHIAIHDWESEEDFHQSGLRDIEKILRGNAAIVAEGSRVLEIGCWIGRLLKPLALERSDLEIYGVDVSTEMILQGKKRLSDFPNVSLSQVNGKDLALFGNDFFDLIFSYVTFQHIPRRYLQDLFKEVYRVFKKGGIFTFQMQSLENNTREEPPENDFRTIRFYTPAMLENMCTHYGFKVLEIIVPPQKEGYTYVTVTK